MTGWLWRWVRIAFASTLVPAALAAGVRVAGAQSAPAPARRVEEAGDSLAVQTRTYQLADLTAAGFVASVDGEDSQTIQSPWIQDHVDASVAAGDDITVVESASNDALYEWDSQVTNGWAAADAFYQQQLNQTLDKLVDQCVVLVDTRDAPATEYYHLPESGPHVNAVIDEAALVHPNVVVVPWSTISASHDEWFWQDGLHFADPADGSDPHPVGAQAFATAITSGVQQCAAKLDAEGATSAPPARFTPLTTPERILDTRDGTGAPAGALPAGHTLDLHVTGADGVPADATSVDLNITAVDEAAPGFLSVFPAGAPNGSSNLNYGTGQVVADHVVAALSASGDLSIQTLSTTDVVVDLGGWYAPSGADGLQTVTPSRILDTRSGLGAPAAPLGQAGSVRLQVAGHGGVPASGVDAVVLNLTATDVSELTVVRAWPSDQPEPLVSNLNPAAGATRANQVTVRVGADGAIRLANMFGRVDLVADVQGWYGPGATSLVAGVAPRRVLDTRTAGDPLGPGQTVTVHLGGVPPVPATATGVYVTVTAVDPTTPGFLVVYPSDHTDALVSDVNFTAGDIVPNLVLVPVGPDGSIVVRNAMGSSDVVVDVTGWVS